MVNYEGWMVDKRGSRSFNLPLFFENLKVLALRGTKPAVGVIRHLSTIFNLNPVISVKRERMVGKDRTGSIHTIFGDPERGVQS